MYDKELVEFDWFSSKYYYIPGYHVTTWSKPSDINLDFNAQPPLILARKEYFRNFLPTDQDSSENLSVNGQVSSQNSSVNGHVSSRNSSMDGQVSSQNSSVGEDNSIASDSEPIPTFEYPKCSYIDTSTSNVSNFDPAPTFEYPKCSYIDTSTFNDSNPMVPTEKEYELPSYMVRKIDDEYISSWSNTSRTTTPEYLVDEADVSSIPESVVDEANGADVSSITESVVDEPNEPDVSSGVQNDYHKLRDYIEKFGHYPSPKISHSFAVEVPYEMRTCQEVDEVFITIRTKRQVNGLDITNRIFYKESVIPLNQVITLHGELEVMVMRNIIDKRNDAGNTLDTILGNLRSAFITLKFLDISDNVLDIATTAVFIDFLSSNCCSKMEILVMLNCLTTETAKMLAKGLTKIQRANKLQNLKQVVFSRNNVQPDGLIPLITNFEGFDNLEVVVI